MKCPKCGSEHVQFATNTSGGGVSLLDSCCGFIFLGPLGLLCGTIGSGAHTEEFWICHDCGHKFSTREGKQRIQNEQQQAATYRQYRAELAKLSATEGNYKTIQEHYQEVVTQRDTMKQQYDQLLLELTCADDRQIKKHAKSLHGKILVNIIGGIFFGGIAFLFLAMPLGICLLVISVVSGIAYELSQKSHRKKLMQLHPGFRAAADALSAAETQVEYYQSLVEKISFIESYEKTQDKS